LTHLSLSKPTKLPLSLFLPKHDSCRQHLDALLASR
jgi:hypothetical protein